MKSSLFVLIPCLIIGVLAHAISNGPIAAAQTPATSARTPLTYEQEKVVFDAIQTNDVAKLKELLENGLDPNSVILGGNTPLMASAAHGGKTEVVRLLLQYKGDPNSTVKGFYIIPALYSAADNGHTEIVSLLLKAGANAGAKFRTRDGSSKKEGHTALIAAIHSPTLNLEIIKLLIDAGAANVPDASDTPPLAFAAFKRQTEVVRMLIAGNANVNAKNKALVTPLIISSMIDGNTEVIRLLVDAKADLEAKDANGNTALTTAAITNSTVVAKALIEAKANVDATDNEGHTALMSAAVGNIELVKLLLAAKANANVKSKPPQDVTALYMAVLSNQPETVKLLIAAGADVNASVFNDTETPVGHAQSKQFTDVIALLTQAGAKSICPSLRITASGDVPKPGDPLVFTVAIGGGDENVSATYNWTVSAGSITSGQGTPKITLDTSAKAIGLAKSITATVDVGGYPRNCATGSSATVSVLSTP